MRNKRAVGVAVLAMFYSYVLRGSLNLFQYYPYRGRIKYRVWWMTENNQERVGPLVASAFAYVELHPELIDSPWFHGVGLRFRALSYSFTIGVGKVAPSADWWRELNGVPVEEIRKGLDGVWEG